MLQTLIRSTPQAARYTPMGGREHCSDCRFFMPQGFCGRVIGPVSPRGWCKYYSREAVQRWSNPGYAGLGAVAPPTLDLNFLAATLDPSITWSRNSSATDGLSSDATGSGFNSFANNIPRISVARGLLNENQRSNLLLNSGAPVTQTTASLVPASYALWVIGTGTATAAAGTAVGSGFGTASAGAPNLFTVTTAGTVVVTVAGSLTRFQLEGSSVPSSYIVTAGATATRILESGTLPVGAWFNAVAGTLVVEFLQPWIALVGQSLNLPSLMTDTSNTLECRITQTAISFISFVANANSGAVAVSGAIAANAVQKVGMTYVAATRAVSTCLNGGAVTNGTPSALPTFNQIKFGNTRTAAQDGFDRRIRYWPRALSAAELQQATT